MTPEDFKVTVFRDDLWGADDALWMWCPLEHCGWETGFDSATVTVWDLIRDARHHILEEHDS